jgi:alpha-tubulin suppressor-like RCC1 family protein
MRNGRRFYSAFAISGLVISLVIAAAAIGAVPVDPPTVTLSFGGNSWGQTGQSANNPTLVAAPVDTLNFAASTITSAAAGGENSLYIGSDGSVFASGFNYWGQTGIGSESFSGAPIPTPINLTNLAGETIVQAALGTTNSLLLSSNGDVYSFGRNDFGQTGLGITSGKTLVATKINAAVLTGKPIKQVAAGDGYSLLLANDGSVFSFGINSGSRNGQGSNDGSTFVVTPVNLTNLGGKTVKQIAAGNGHALLLANDGTVYSFGDNGAGQTGQGTTVGYTPFAAPINTSNLLGKTITQVAAGEGHSLLLASDGTVFSFGSNNMGRTGLGIGTGITSIATPIDTSNLGGRKIVQVAAGDFFSVLLTEDHTVYSFGLNSRAGQGGAIDGNTLVATPISTIKITGLSVNQIFAGGDHAILLASSIPEPSSALMLISSATLLLTRRRKSVSHNRV